MPISPFQIAIVGRPNVGKSALFNRLAGRRIAIVHDQPGVTRDRIAAPCSLTETPCELVDTGGICAVNEDGFSNAVTFEARIAMDSADLIVFVVDARAGINPIDEEVAQLLRKSNPNVVLVMNKADSADHDDTASDFARLGFGNGIPTSAEHGRGMDHLVDRMESELSKLETRELEEVDEAELKDGLKIAVVGKPNAGKSSLINAILKDERTIVSDVAGTTRDAVDVPYIWGNERHNLIDTAGLRKRSSMEDSVEVFSAMRSERSIRRADICLLVIDLAAGVAAQDRKIARMIQEEKKPCLIIANKFDLYHPQGQKSARVEEAREHLRRELFFLDYAPFVCVSAMKGQAIQHIFKTITRIRDNAQEVIGTGQLNRLLQDAFIKVPPPEHKRHRKRLKLFYATTAVNDRYQAIPVPEYVLFVNDKHLIVESYQGYLVNTIKDKHPTDGLPIPLSFRSRSKKDRLDR
ncbi:MAG: ribosome biogenesis GTPase Der [Akkermansiaceae bacterium]